MALGVLATLILVGGGHALSPSSEADRVVNLPGLPAPLANLSQFAGFLPAGEGGSLFYWLVEHEGSAAADDADVPIVLWLQGGPGASSLFSLFTETGPFRVSETTNSSSSSSSSSSPPPELHIAPVRWTSAAHVLYLDQPFGTGFSFAQSDSLAAVVHNETALRDAAAAALLAFFARHPQHARRPLFIFGESFAGHMAPNIAWKLLQLESEHRRLGATAATAAAAAAASSPFPVNLQGLAIGDGWVEPTAQNLAFPDYAYGVGLIGDELRAELRAKAAACAAVIAGGNYTAAFFGPCYYQMLNPIVAAAGGVSPYDVRVFTGGSGSGGGGIGGGGGGGSNSGGGGAHARYLAARAGRAPAAAAAAAAAVAAAAAATDDDDDGGGGFAGAALQTYLDSDAVRAALHLPPSAQSGKWGLGNGSSFVEQGLIPDLNAPTSLPLWPALLAKIRIVAYNGNFDLICNHLGTDAYLRSLDWPGQADFLAAPRKVWTVPAAAAAAAATATDSSGSGRAAAMAGWSRSGGNLTQLVIANAGHMAPADAPVACMDMLGRVLAGEPW